MKYMNSCDAIAKTRHQIMSKLALVGTLSTFVIVGCGVRDTSEDLVGSAASGSGSGTASGTPASAIGSDTTAIAGFWNPNFGGANQLYIVISDVGDWTYVREDPNQNCFNAATHPITKVNTTEYTINENGFIYTIDAQIGVDGNLDVSVVSGDSSFASYEPVVNIMAQDLQLCGN
ncbi:MAG: hypothetical protein AB8B79_03490 [Granulosicoccus sp.]